MNSCFVPMRQLRSINRHEYCHKAPSFLDSGARKLWLADAEESHPPHFSAGRPGALKATGIDFTIFVQAAPTVAETGYMLDIDRRTPWVLGVVGWIDLLAPGLSRMWSAAAMIHPSLEFDQRFRIRRIQFGFLRKSWSRRCVLLGQKSWSSAH